VSNRGKNPNSLANLKPAKKGEVRNPVGINSKRPFSDYYFFRAEEVVPEPWRKRLNKDAGGPLIPKGATWGEADSRRLHLEAAKGNVNAIRELADRVEGKAPQRLEITGPVRKEVTLRVVYENRKKQE
jgi:hypothetical protein